MKMAAYGVSTIQEALMWAQQDLEREVEIAREDGRTDSIRRLSDVIETIENVKYKLERKGV